MNTLTVEQAIEKVGFMSDKFNTQYGESSNIMEFKKRAVDRFDLSVAYHNYAMQNYPDCTTVCNEESFLLRAIWKAYNRDRVAQLKKYPEFAKLCSHQTIEDFRNEL